MREYLEAVFLATVLYSERSPQGLKIKARKARYDPGILNFLEK